MKTWPNTPTNTTNSLRPHIPLVTQADTKYLFASCSPLGCTTIPHGPRSRKPRSPLATRSPLCHCKCIRSLGDGLDRVRKSVGCRFMHKWVTPFFLYAWVLHVVHVNAMRRSGSAPRRETKQANEVCGHSNQVSYLPSSARVSS